MVKKMMNRKAVRILKKKGYKSACRGVCGRRMKKVARKVKEQKKKFVRRIKKLKKVKGKDIKTQLKKLGIRKRKMTKKSYKVKMIKLNQMLASRTITRS